MKRNNIVKILILLAGFFSTTIYFSYNLKPRYGIFKNLISLNENQKKIIKKYFLPFRTISQQEKIIQDQESNLQKIVPYLQDLELYKKESGSDIKAKVSITKLSENKVLRKLNLTSGFYSGIYFATSGSGSAFIDFDNENLFILSSRGLLAFNENFNDKATNFKQITNNINQFISLEQFKKRPSFSVKDLLIFKNYIFVSFTEEIKENCWNTSLIKGDINYKKINFVKLFSSQECIHSENNIDKEFQPLQSGGRIISYDKNNILLSIGDYRSRHLAQNINSINGKIVKINIKNGSFKIISLGHRNPQGLLFDKEKNIILETEHGPMGGDEINLIKVNDIEENNLPNYGWPISSAGEHYSYIKGDKRKEIYKKYPLHKSHSDYGFVEPLKSFVPSIAISEIVKIGNNSYVLSSLKDKSLYFFKLNKENEIIKLKRVFVGERIRDLKFKNKQLYLFLEDTASIGIIDLS
ncbi:MAG: PQQ-dependent sugar dehydrogenase [Prochlorococcus marinus XMU1428]|nr:PQQ-dependent sugar dehydrogenase [Prochlorococcus marinus XMU1428]